MSDQFKQESGIKKRHLLLAALLGCSVTLLANNQFGGGNTQAMAQTDAPLTSLLDASSFYNGIPSVAEYGGHHVSNNFDVPPEQYPSGQYFQYTTPYFKEVFCHPEDQYDCLPDGYRYLYIDELITNEHNLQGAIQRFLGDWHIVAVVNGWTDGPGYGGSVKKDGGERNLGWTLFVNKEYPVWIEPACINDLSTTDAAGDTCAWYFEDVCSGQWDDGDFHATTQCCACGGGSIPSGEPQATWFQSSGGSSISITFKNNMSETITMYWFDYSGQRVSYGTIAPGGTMPMTTYVTHPWSAQTASGKVDVDGDAVWVPVASDNGREIVISE